MRRVAHYVFTGIGVVSGGLACGAATLIYFNLRDYDDDRWFWLLVIAMLLAILSATAIALSVVLYEERPLRIREVAHPIAVGRSGAPEITDPMPGPARVRRPVSEAYNPEKRTLSEED